MLDGTFNAELEKVKVSEVSIQTGPKIREVSNVKGEESETHDEEKFKIIPCQFFHQKNNAGEEKSAGTTMIKFIRKSRKIQSHSKPQQKSSKFRKEIKRRAGRKPKASYYRSVKAVTKRK